MQKVLTWIGGTFLALFVAAALTFGVEQVIASSPGVAAVAVSCDEFCPSDPNGCDRCCRQLGATGGSCEGDEDQLCECFL